jgi:hypothetical protein
MTIDFAWTQIQPAGNSVRVAVVILGGAIATFGFMVMRDPMTLSLLSFRTQEGYFQRVVLDRSQRIQMRVLGVLVSFFGLVILTAALNKLSKTFDSLADVLFVMMGLVFWIAFAFGLVHAMLQLKRGELFSSFRMWRTGVELGPISVYPPKTPTMLKEAKAFMMAYIALVVLAVGIAIIY